MRARERGVVTVGRTGANRNDLTQLPRFVGAIGPVKVRAEGPQSAHRCDDRVADARGRLQRGPTDPGLRRPSDAPTLRQEAPAPTHVAKASAMGISTSRSRPAGSRSSRHHALGL